MIIVDFSFLFDRASSIR